MKGYRNVGNAIVEIDVDIDTRGRPILPPDSTVDPKPEAQDGHYVTIVGNSWVQIAKPVEYIAFDYKKQQALEKLSQYRSWYIEQTVEVNGIVYDADDQARNRLIQALVIYNATNYLPPAWIAADNTPQPLATIADLQAIITGVQTAFSTRFFECDSIRQQIIAAETEEALAAIEVPVIPNQF